MVKTYWIRTLCAALAVFMGAGFTIEEGMVSQSITTVITDPPPYQPQDERAAQEALPQSDDTHWATLKLAHITFDEQEGLFKASIPDSIQKLSGTKMRISGFILPLEPTDSFQHFLLSKRTPTCAFCPPGSPNEIVEVMASTPTAWDEGLVTYEGEFEVIQNTELGIFFKLKDAQKK